MWVDNFSGINQVGHLPDDSQAGVTHCFVNLGSDHPSIIEAMVKGQHEKKDQFPSIITCPKYVLVVVYSQTWEVSFCFRETC